MNGALPENAVLLSYHRSSSQDQRERGTHAGHLKALREDAEKHNWPLHRFEDLPVYKPDVKLSKGRVDGSVFVDETQTVLLEPEPNTHSLSAVLAPEPKKIHKCERSLTTARTVLHPVHALESCHVLTEEEVEDRLNTAPCEEDQGHFIMANVARSIGNAFVGGRGQDRGTNSRYRGRKPHLLGNSAPIQHRNLFVPGILWMHQEITRQTSKNQSNWLQPKVITP